MKLTHIRVGDIEDTGAYSIHPIDGLTSVTRISGMNHWSLMITLKYPARRLTRPSVMKTSPKKDGEWRVFEKGESSMRTIIVTAAILLCGCAIPRGPEGYHEAVSVPSGGSIPIVEGEPVELKEPKEPGLLASAIIFLMEAAVPSEEDCSKFPIRYDSKTGDYKPDWKRFDYLQNWCEDPPPMPVVNRP